MGHWLNLLYHIHVLEHCGVIKVPISQNHLINRNMSVIYSVQKNSKKYCIEDSKVCLKYLCVDVCALIYNQYIHMHRKRSEKC